MKISVIVPVYNEKEAITQCLDALLGQDYQKNDYEIIVVNDGSTDGTGEVVEKYPVRLINFEKNMGRVIAREKGALEAKYEMLYFVDSRVIPDPDVLSTFVRIGYQPNIGGDHYTYKYRSVFDTLFYLIRRKAYRPYFPQYLFEEGRDYYYIDESNFDASPKGSSSVYISRELFLSARIEERGKNVSDDTMLLRNVVKKRRILRHSDIKITYLQRTNALDVLKHIFQRGPKFTHYYLAKGGKFRRPFLLALCAGFLCAILTAWLPSLLVYEGTILITGLLACSIWLSENLKDFFIVLICLLPLSIAFMSGIVKGLFLDVLNKWDSL